MRRLGTRFAATGLSADFWTAVGLVLSIAAGAAYASSAVGFHWYHAAVVGGLLLLVSGFFDMVDGSVARATGKTSKKGAFLDSSFDKIAESVIFLGLAAGGLAHPVWALLALAMSLLVSYTRARAESLGVELKGIGIGERAERMLILAFIGFIPHPDALTWATIIVSIVAGITLGQRIAATSKKLSTI
ncbi:MAG TPA: CDP-alcohol phosphatidyltransferase family protein [Nitrososphaera sp.]|nr:CDP-alcohol phosphatidyltransferase family protein [Nitrososphaera sp.]